MSSNSNPIPSTSASVISASINSAAQLHNSPRRSSQEITLRPISESPFSLGEINTDRVEGYLDSRNMVIPTNLTITHVNDQDDTAILGHTDRRSNAAETDRIDMDPMTPAPIPRNNFPTAPFVITANFRSALDGRGPLHARIFNDPPSMAEAAGNSTRISQALEELEQSIHACLKNNGSARYTAYQIRACMSVITGDLETLRGSYMPPGTTTAKISIKAKVLDMVKLMFDNAPALGLDTAYMSGILDNVQLNLNVGYEKPEGRHANAFMYSGSSSVTTGAQWEIPTQKRAVKLLANYAPSANPTNPDRYTLPLIRDAKSLNPSSGDRRADVQGALFRGLEKTITRYPFEAKVAIKNSIVEHHDDFSEKPPAGHSNRLRKSKTLQSIFQLGIPSSIVSIPVAAISAAATAAVSGLLWPIAVTVGGVTVIAGSLLNYQKFRNLFRHSTRDRMLSRVVLKAVETMTPAQSKTYGTQLIAQAPNLDRKYQSDLIKFSRTLVKESQEQIDAQMATRT